MRLLKGVGTRMVPDTGNRVDKGRGVAAGLVAAPVEKFIMFFTDTQSGYYYSDLLNLFGLHVT
jgi:hypothetical protein